MHNLNTNLEHVKVRKRQDIGNITTDDMVNVQQKFLNRLILRYQVLDRISNPGEFKHFR